MLGDRQGNGEYGTAKYLVHNIPHYLLNGQGRLIQTRFLPPGDVFIELVEYEELEDWRLTDQHSNMETQANPVDLSKVEFLPGSTSPAQLGDYRTVREIGRGGMGEKRAVAQLRLPGSAG
jgi:hypothetical protein